MKTAILAFVALFDMEVKLSFICLLESRRLHLRDDSADEVTATHANRAMQQLITKNHKFHLLNGRMLTTAYYLRDSLMMAILRDLVRSKKSRYP